MMIQKSHNTDDGCGSHIHNVKLGLQNVVESVLWFIIISK